MPTAVLMMIGHTAVMKITKIADGWLSADGKVIYRAFDLKVGLFRDADAMKPSAA